MRIGGLRVGENAADEKCRDEALVIIENGCPVACIWRLRGPSDYASMYSLRIVT